MDRQRFWDERFIMLASYIAQWSKDPSTKTGAVIVRPNRSVASIGYNGFPIGIEDTEERLNNRQLKLKIIRHCEENAVAFAREPIVGYTIYTWPFMSCSHCASMLVQSGIYREVAPPLPSNLKENWEEDTKISEQLFSESHVVLDIVSIPTWK